MAQRRVEIGDKNTILGWAKGSSFLPILLISFNASEQFKMISTIIKSGYEESSLLNQTTSPAF